MNNVLQEWDVDSSRSEIRDDEELGLLLTE